MPEEEKLKTKPNLSILALISFVASFAVARIFTSIYPAVFWKFSGYHIHHFWYGLVMLAISGWLGISVENERVNRVAAILFGAGGGLIVDEIGLLLTLESESYWAEITYTFVIMFLTFASMVILLNKYSKTIRTEFTEFLSSNASLYFGVFLAAVSVAFILETDNLAIVTFSSVSAIAACLIILAYFVQRIRKR
ncbi:MAG: hypothetical protein OEY22_03025 [Candidatus Bathyarchaeota archaeon]|nr:hypothetical protein [Candidatus Bathyarchaeota archaeon]MDH5787535.1 hypothetical protein [Candidatus Bathyarchaeota archaeon]